MGDRVDVYHRFSAPCFLERCAGLSHLAVLYWYDGQLSHG